MSLNLTKLAVTLTLWILSTASLVAAGVEGFEETFRGRGSHPSVDGALEGLDNPGWVAQRIPIAGDAVVELTDDGLLFEARATGVVPQTLVSFVSVGRLVTGAGSFIDQLSLHNLDLTRTVNQQPDASNALGVRHLLRGVEDNDAETEIGFNLNSARQDAYNLNLSSGNQRQLLTVPRADNISMAIAFDSDQRQVTFSYRDLDSVDPPLESTLPFNYEGEIADQHEVWFDGFASLAGQYVSGTLSRWTLRGLSNIVGDFSANEVLDTEDIDLLTDAIRAGTDEAFFDLNGDSSVDLQDQTVWVHDIKKTFFGDADLNGLFNSQDLVNVFTAGLFEDEVARNSTWATGDWDGDGDFTTSDIVLAFEDGGYERGPRPALSAIPEPTSSVMLLAAWIIFALGRITRWRALS